MAADGLLCRGPGAAPVHGGAGRVLQLVRRRPEQLRRAPDQRIILLLVNVLR